MLQDLSVFVRKTLSYVNKTLLLRAINQTGNSGKQDGEREGKREREGGRGRGEERRREGEREKRERLIFHCGHTGERKKTSSDHSFQPLHSVHPMSIFNILSYG